MGVITTAAFVVLGIVGASLSKILADDFKSWSPLLVRRIVRFAANRLPESLQERHFEEWLAHVGETPGDIGKILVALGFIIAAVRMATFLNGCWRRASDIVVATGLLAMLLPMMSMIALGILVTSPGPIFFRQLRIGRDMRTFEVLRFRTMRCVVPDNGTVQQVTSGDQRVTPFGRFLRSHNLDLLPQIINVIRGDMSLVGPRPNSLLPPK